MDLHPVGRRFVLWGARCGDVQIGSAEDHGIQAFLGGFAASMRLARQFADGMELLNRQAMTGREAMAKLAASLRRIHKDGVPCSGS